jgi:hypothetical protein
VQIAAVILAFALLAIVLYVISAPLRADPAQARRETSASSHERAELEAAREAKYREIRDAELDMRTGKLSRADYESIDAALRAERARQPRVLARVHEHQEHDDHGDDHLQHREDRFHALKVTASVRSGPGSTGWGRARESPV